MHLNRKDLYKLVEMLKQFPDVEVFEIEQTNHSGIGSVTSVAFEQEVNGQTGVFTIEISGVEDW